MAAEIKEAFGKEAEMGVGELGTFDVIVNGKTIFSVAKELRFPKPGEIVDLIKEHLKK